MSYLEAYFSIKDQHEASESFLVVFLKLYEIFELFFDLMFMTGPLSCFAVALILFVVKSCWKSKLEFRFTAAQQALGCCIHLSCIALFSFITR